jgi:virginiamycin B lyase
MPTARPSEASLLIHLTQPSRRDRRRRRPRLEALEGRTLLTAGLTEFTGPFSVPVDVTTGPDGNLWVLNQGADGNGSLVVIAPDHTVKATYPIPTPNAWATALTVGPDGNVWFVEQSANKIGKVTPDGTVTEYPIPDTVTDDGSGSGPIDIGASPTDLVAGPDGALWFTESSTQKIGRITTDGTITEIATPNMQPQSIAVGSDHNVWFTDAMNGTVDRINADGTVSTFTIPASFASPDGLTLGPDGALYFVDGDNNAVGRVTTDGTVTETPIAADITPNRLTFDAAGNLWVDGTGTAELVRITPQGVTTPLGPGPSAVGGLGGLTVAPDGTIWVTDNGTDAVGTIDPATVNPAPTDNTLTITTQVNGPGFAPDGLAFGGDLATFYDSNPAGAAGDFSASIDWGDGTTSAGSVRATGAGTFVVSGDHTYATDGLYTLAVSVTDTNPASTPQPNTVSTSETVFVGAPPVVLNNPLPPFNTASTPPGASAHGGGPVAQTPAPKAPKPAPKPKPVALKPTVFPDIRTLVRQFEMNLLRATLARKHLLPKVTAPLPLTIHIPMALHTPVRPVVAHLPKLPALVFGGHLPVLFRNPWAAFARALRHR